MARSQKSSKTAPNGQENTPRQLTLDELKWWHIAELNANNAYYGATSYLPVLSQVELWNKSVDWIYDHFNRLGDMVLTGITTKQLEESLKRCTHEHISDLPWSFLRPGTREYVKMVRRKGLKEVRAWQSEFLRGSRDLDGNWWCGLCYARCACMTIGHHLGYPDMYDLYAEERTRDISGYAAWLPVVTHGSEVVIETVRRHGDEVLKQRKQEAA